MKKARRKTPRNRVRTVSTEEYALLLRNNMTKAEQCFWLRLKKEQRKWTHKFKPQVVVHGYIPDFYCETLQLAVEIDGKVHRRSDVRRNDRLRTRRLNRMGVTVIRFQNSDVFSTISNLMRILESVCN